jgi:hypothetical protein
MSEERLVPLPCGHTAAADHESGERLHVCGCTEPVNPKKPEGEQQPVKWAIVSHRVTEITYTAKRVS